MKPGLRLYYFYSNDPWPFDKANVTHRNFDISVGRFTSAETFRFDIDHDGLDDVLVWEGTGISDNQEIGGPGNPQAYYRIFFLNIGGEWYLYGEDEYIYNCSC